jgi:hypothetical protein
MTNRHCSPRIRVRSAEAPGSGQPHCREQPSSVAISSVGEADLNVVTADAEVAGFCNVDDDRTRELLILS